MPKNMSMIPMFFHEVKKFALLRVCTHTASCHTAVAIAAACLCVWWSCHSRVSNVSCTNRHMTESYVCVCKTVKTTRKYSGVIDWTEIWFVFLCKKRTRTKNAKTREIKSLCLYRMSSKQQNHIVSRMSFSTRPFRKIQNKERKHKKSFIRERHGVCWISVLFFFCLFVRTYVSV